jgi:type IV secretory pathway VirB10-like protein
MKKLWTHRPLRMIVAGLATLATGAGLASAGVVGVQALDSGSSAAKQYPGKKVTICHRTHSKKHPWVQIRVSVNALKAHIGHGDFVVTPATPCPPATVAATSKKNKQKHGKSSTQKQHGKSATKKQHGKSSTQKQHGKSSTQKQHGKSSTPTHGKSEAKQQQQGNSATQKQHGKSEAKKQHGKPVTKPEHANNGVHQGGNDSHPDNGNHGKK